MGQLRQAVPDTLRPCWGLIPCAACGGGNISLHTGEEFTVPSIVLGAGASTVPDPAAVALVDSPPGQP